MQSPIRFLALLVGLVGLGLVVGPVAADKDDPAQIDKLIEQLGSGHFQEREAATKALDAIGAPALEKLRAAAQGDDAEIKRRATDLVKRIEKRAQLSRILTPKRVHLVYKDTPLKEALEDLKKKSGYDLSLHDPEKKLADRKVTVDTGDVTFWEAFDKFCDAAGLMQTSQQEMMMQMYQEQMQRAVKDLGVIQQKAPPPAPPAKKPEAKEAPAKPAREKTEEKPGAAPKPKAEAKAEERRGAEPAKAAAIEAAARAERAVALAQAQVVLQVQAAGARPAVLMDLAGGTPAGPSEQILLKDGKRKALPTHYAGSVRIRATEPAQQPGGEGAPLLVNLQVSTEPKFQLRSVSSVKITKAVDDNGQSLSQITPGEDANAVEIAVAPGGLVRKFAVANLTMPYSIAGPGITTIPLKKGEKPSKSLEELSGTLVLDILDEPEVMIAVDNVLKAGDTTTKGKKGGQLKVVSATKKDNGQVTLQVEMEMPPDVVAAGTPGFGGGFMSAPMIRFNAIKAVAPPPPVALPVAPPAAEKPKAAPPKDEKVPAKEQGKDKDVPDQPKPEKAPAKEQPKEKEAAVPPPPPVAAARVIAAPAVAVGQAAFSSVGRPAGNSFNGLTLVDDKGKSWQIVNVNVSTRVGAAGTVENTYELTFEAKEKQGEPAKLIFSGCKTVSVEVPFTLKKVPLQ
jgi:outer membrane biosynthesis protein TonB